MFSTTGGSFCTVCTNWSSTICSIGFLFVKIYFLSLLPAQPSLVVKQKLLCHAGVSAETARVKALVKIFCDYFLYPNVNGERVVLRKTEQQGAVGNLRSNSFHRAKRLFGFGRGEFRHRGNIKLTADNLLCRVDYVRRAKAHFQLS